MTAFNFSQVHKKELIDFKLPLVGDDGKPSFLIIAPATEDNPEYYKEIIELSSTRTFRDLATGDITEDKEKAGRDKDKQLYAKHVVKGWRNIQDTDGNDVPFSYENVLELLNVIDLQVSKGVFTQLRMVASRYENFLSKDALDTEEMVKN